MPTFQKQFVLSIKVKKSFYREYFPNYFKSDNFDLLCKTSSDKLPIVPIPEVVKGMNGVWVIHDSFIFPILMKRKVVLVWESLEMSKATYLFTTGVDNFDATVQDIFDYLTGETVNKRESLHNSKQLQIALSFDKKIIHQQFKLWKDELNFYLDDL